MLFEALRNSSDTTPSLPEPPGASLAGAASPTGASLNLSKRIGLSYRFHLEISPSAEITVGVMIPDSQFAALQSKLDALSQPSNLQVFAALREACSSNIFRFRVGYVGRIKEEVALLGDPYSSDNAPEKAAYMLSALSSHIRSGRRAMLNASALNIKVSSESGECLEGHAGLAPGLVEFREKFAHLLSKGPGKGNEERWSGCVTRAHEAAVYVERVWTAHRDGKPIRAIAAQEKSTEQTIHSILRGELPRAMIELKHAGFARAQPHHRLEGPRQESPEWAAALAAFLAVSEFGGTKDKILIHSNDEAKIRKVEKAFQFLNLSAQTSLLQVPRSNGTKLGWRFCINSPAAADTFAELTSHGQSLPWAVLETPKEKLAFLQMFFYMHGGASKSVFSFSSLRFGVATGVATLLEELGIAAGSQIKEGALLFRIYSPHSLRRALQLDLLTPPHAVKLRARSEQADPAHCPVTEYRNVLRFHSQNAKATYAEIGAACGVSETTAYRWLKTGSRPGDVRSLEELAKLKVMTKIPHPGAAVALFRTLNYSPQAAMTIAEQLSLPQVMKVTTAFSTLSGTALPPAERFIDAYKKLARTKS